MKRFDVPIREVGKRDLAGIVEKLGMRGKMDTRPVVLAVQDILNGVRTGGDRAISGYTAQFDLVNVKPGDFRVSEEEIEQACGELDPEVYKSFEKAAVNILAFHKKGLPTGFREAVSEGAETGVMIRPLDTVGVYVPGGTAPLPSSVLMNVLPARAAGVRRIVMCTPPRRDGTVDPSILAAARVAGVDEVYRIGGAQAVAAMAYGTRTIPMVDKVCGPGNIYVNTAKRLVFGQVDIDLFAGPSEILILADKGADPACVAADMLSQAEHDVMASAVLVTDSVETARATAAQIRAQAPGLPRSGIVEKSLADYSAILLVPDIETAVDFANALAPEHLEICTEDPEGLLPGIRNAGAVFLGAYSPEPLGDYMAGPNHVLPTSGTARFFSPLNATDFLKRINVISYTKEALRACRQDVERIAETEGLRGHADSIRARFADSED